MKKNDSLFLKIILIIFTVIVLTYVILSFGIKKDEEKKVINIKSNQAYIYYNEACSMCAMYVKKELPKMLEAQGINDITKRDYVNDKEARKEMNVIMEDMKIPFSMQSHIMTFVGDKYVIGGHVPENIISDLFKEENAKRFKKIVIYQDEMHEDVKDYKVLAVPNYSNEYAGEVKTYEINSPITKHLDYINNSQLLDFNRKESLLPMVLIYGFLDGINPCAFAVLLFFISFLYTLKRTKKDIWKTGIVYIFAIFLAYIAIGFGLIGAVMLIDEPHVMARIGAWLVIVLGIINIIGLLFPKFPIKLRIPHVAKGTIKTYTHKATLPSAFILGFFVGLCTFPCSGGVYVAIIGLLFSQTTYLTGISYLILYNLMFILPLVITLILVSNKKSLDVFQKWEQSKVPQMKFLGAVAMVVLGVIILVWFT